ncbi:SUN-like methylase [Cryptosporidium canis]|uniref:SUN-like methylase n=1 Tax=Cryptosporidium canis TaxID=195482 RepID=A0ABQ8PA25_9CRYT|nr:SUN-like methylase [Cryptosporidium canis]KAJ1614111.1 SUN-like methylase [Cryptosporidium canis]
MSTLYLEAAKVLNKIEKKNAGVRSVLYSEKQGKCNIRKLGAIVHGVNGKKKELEVILRKSRLLEDSEFSKVSNYWLLLVLAYEQLFGNLKIQGGGALARLIRSNKDKLYECLTKEFPELLKESNDVKINEQIPRYLRVNTSIENTGTVLESILDQLRQTNQFENEDLLKYVWIDKDINSLIVCKNEVAKLLNLDRIPSTNELIRASKVALQDKGSCFPPICAKITPGDFVLDACSAPGSKTLHIIDMLNKRGRLVALDKDSKRIKTMIKRISEVPYLHGPFIYKGEALEYTEAEKITDEFLSTEVGCIFLNKESGIVQKNGLIEISKLNISNAPELLIHVAKCDFLNLKLNTNDHCLPWYNFRNTLSKVRTIILDPSCSGSGLPHHGKVEKENIKERLKGLSEFQTKMLVHSLTSFQSVETVCYSTCSVFTEENEQVVFNSMEICKNNKNLRFSLDIAIDGWVNPPKSYDNSSLDDIHKKCLFVNTETHNCRGFFLAKFVSNSSSLDQ